MNERTTTNPKAAEQIFSGSETVENKLRKPGFNEDRMTQQFKVLGSAGEVLVEHLGNHFADNGSVPSFVQLNSEVGGKLKSYVRRINKGSYYGFLENALASGSLAIDNYVMELLAAPIAAYKSQFGLLPSTPTISGFIQNDGLPLVTPDEAEGLFGESNDDSVDLEFVINQLKTLRHMHVSRNLTGDDRNV